MQAIVLTGETGGKMMKQGWTTICVPSTVTQFIQESHIMIGHILCEVLERSLSDDEHGIAGKSAVD